MRSFLLLLLSYLMAFMPLSVTAQIVPDDTLPQNTVVTPNGKTSEITGGTIAGDNLFHSFEQFSLSTGSTAFFNNPQAIVNILSRVTGDSISNIDGLIRANGSANLFLINPNGIVFGNNAALNIGGSFIGSTASGLNFADGTEFDAVNPDPEALLTVSIPIGLQYGSNSGDITVQGTGNNLKIDPDTLIIDRSDRPVGLQVPAQRTLALIGGNVHLAGGNLTAGGGKVELGSVANSGLVEFTANNLGFNFDYQGVANFQDISLTQAAAVEVSGNNGGNVTLHGREIEIVDGSAILAGTLGDGTGELLEIVATEKLEVSGFSADNSFISLVATNVDVAAAGDGGDLTIESDRLLVADGAQINSGTFGRGNAGNLSVTAREIEVIGEFAEGEFISGLFAQSDFGQTGNGGDLTVTTETLRIADGAQISTATFGTGNAGDLVISANEIEIAGFSSLNSGTVAGGNGGDISLTTDSLLIANGAQISTNTFGSGNAGSLNILAQDIQLKGTSPEGIPSGILATVEPLDDNTIQTEATGDRSNLTITTDRLKIDDGAQISTSTLGSKNAGNLVVQANESIRIRGSGIDGRSGLFANAVAGDGAGGNLNVNTELLSLSDGATINVSNFPSISNTNQAAGQGAAGNLSITAPEIILEDRARLSANTFSGDRGNINLTTDLLILGEASNISTNAQGDATGGNITIDASNGFLIAAPQDNSDITANAVFGNGGRVDITALEIFGLKPSQNTTPFSDITASSEFGIAGNVDLNTQDLDSVRSVVELPDTVAAPQLAQGCQVATDDAASNSSFVNVGRGGLRPQPDEPLGSSEILGDVRVPSQWSESNQANVSGGRLNEAQGWIVNERGKVMLVAEVPHESAATSSCNLLTE